MSIDDATQIRVEVTGAPGESVASTARRTGAWGAAAGDTDAQVLDKLAQAAIDGVAATTSYFEDMAFAVTDASGSRVLAYIDEAGGFQALGGSPVTGARIDNVADNEGNRVGHLAGADNLREFARYRNQLRNGDNVLLHVVMGPGDSYTADDIGPRMLARRWKTELGNGGFGWTGVGFPSSLDGSSNAAKSAGAQGNIDPAVMTLAFSGTGWTGQFTSQPGSPDLCSATSSTVGDRITFTYAEADTIATVALHYLGTLDIRYRWNGGAWAAMTAGTPTGAAVALSGVPAGTWTLDVEVVSGTAQIAGINGLRASGVVVHDIANNGSALVNWARLDQSPATWRADHAAALARLGAVRAFVVMLGANDQGQQFTPDQYGRAMRREIDEVLRVAAPGADILWMMQPENGRSGETYPQRIAGYTAAAKPIATEKRAALLDLQPLFGASYAEYGHLGTARVLFENDALHPNTAGNAVIWPAAENALTYRS